MISIKKKKVAKDNTKYTNPLQKHAHENVNHLTEKVFICCGKQQEQQTE